MTFRSHFIFMKWRRSVVLTLGKCSFLGVLIFCGPLHAENQDLFASCCPKNGAADGHSASRETPRVSGVHEQSRLDLSILNAE